MYNSRSIFQFADALNGRANLIVGTYTVLGLLIGAFLGSQYGDLTYSQRGEIWTILGVVIGGFVMRGIWCPPEAKAIGLTNNAH
ncbi:MAG: hypothetical protein AAF702_22820 [Chloroflexota bacterium]